MECWSIGVVERKVDSHMKNTKKEYKKPEVKRVSLDAKCAVLAFCKTSGSLGPDDMHCGLPNPPSCIENPDFTSGF
jgi:hypothetical protein